LTCAPPRETKGKRKEKGEKVAGEEQRIKGKSYSFYHAKKKGGSETAHSRLFPVGEEEKGERRKVPRSRGLRTFLTCSLKAPSRRERETEKVYLSL